MNFIRDAWYCAGFSRELQSGALKPITILGEPVVLYRQAGGTAAALADRCPHRFAPLSMGKVCEGEVQCAYHGLRFDAAGLCTHNPHGDGSIPKAAKVRSYPLLERHGALWIWTGEAAQAESPGRAHCARLPSSRSAPPARRRCHEGQRARRAI